MELTGRAFEVRDLLGAVLNDVFFDGDCSVISYNRLAPNSPAVKLSSICAVRTPLGLNLQ
jgi:hypothetical protein